MKTRKAERGIDNFIFANIYEGEFRQRVKEGTEGAVKRTNAKGVEIWEIATNEIEDVLLRSLSVRDTDYGKQLNITLRDIENSEKHFVITCALTSGYAVSFLSRIENIDCLKPIKVSIYEIENIDKETGKKSKTRTLTVVQAGKKIEKIWNNDNNPVPKAEPIKDKKGKQLIKNGFPAFDSTEKEAFLEKYANEMNDNLNESHLKNYKESKIV